jgi:hypothetical protein
MFKKIILAIMVFAVLVSVGLVFAQEEETDGRERQMGRGQGRRLEQDGPLDRPVRRGSGPMNRRQGALATGLDRWLGELTEAYRMKDHEKMGQLLRRMNQARQKVQQRGEQYGPSEKGFRKGRGSGQGRMRRGKTGQAGLRAGRMERFAPPMRGRGPAGRPRRVDSGQRMGRRQAGTMGRPGRGMGRGGQGFGQRDRRMLRLRERAGERFGGMGRRQGGRNNRRGFIPPKGLCW